MTHENASLRIAGPGRVTRLSLERRDDELTVLITLLPDGAPNPIDVRFLGATDVRFLGERTQLTELVLLFAEDITSRGWDGVRFLVRDSEEEVISFACRAIEPEPH